MASDAGDASLVAADHRLGARIWDLRDEGYEIEERKVAGKNWSQYRLRPTRKIELPPAYDKPRVEQRKVGSLW